MLLLFSVSNMVLVGKSIEPRHKTVILHRDIWPAHGVGGARPILRITSCRPESQRLFRARRFGSRPSNFGSAKPIATAGCFCAEVEQGSRGSTIRHRVL